MMRRPAAARYQYDALIEGGLLTQQFAVQIVRIVPRDQHETLAVKLIAVADSERSRKEKKAEVKAIVQSMLGKRPPSQKRKPESWQAQLDRQLRETRDMLPTSITDLGNNLASQDVHRASLREVRRQYADFVDGCPNQQPKLDARAKRQVEATISALLGLLSVS